MLICCQTDSTASVPKNKTDHTSAANRYERILIGSGKCVRFSMMSRIEYMNIIVPPTVAEMTSSASGCARRKPTMLQPNATIPQTSQTYNRFSVIEDVGRYVVLRMSAANRLV